MSDQWKARIITIAGKPVALVDVHIERTIFVDANAFERIAPLLRGGDQNDYGKSGLTGVADFFDDIQQIPEKMRSFVIVPWTAADSDEVGLRPFSEILRRLEDESYWRVEGNADSGFRGILNFGGQDQVMNISESTAPLIQAEISRIRAAAATDVTDGTLTQNDKNNIDRVCDAVGRDTLACVKFERLQREVRAENDRVKRERQQRDLRDQERRQAEHGEHQGEVRRSIGDRFSGFGTAD
jgi:hypothetical protein